VELAAELQGLREIATSGPSTATGPTPLSHRKVLDAQDHLDILRGGGDADYDNAVDALVEAAQGFLDGRHAAVCRDAPGGKIEPWAWCECRFRYMRAALERVKGAGA